jgi:RNA polymerase sigma-70 factor (ECF subfamily)
VEKHQIVQRCKQGDKDAFRALVNHYSKKLMGVCIRYLKDKDQAKDALQETFIRIFKSIKNFNEDGNFEGWIRRIAINESLKIIQKNVIFLDADSSLVDNQLLVLPSVSQKLNENDILNEINKLPEHYRVIFNLYEIEGYSHKEIASLLGIKESSSRTKLMRAKTQLKDFFLILDENEKIVSEKFI